MAALSLETPGPKRPVRRAAMLLAVASLLETRVPKRLDTRVVSLVGLRSKLLKESGRRSNKEFLRNLSIKFPHFSRTLAR